MAKFSYNLLVFLSAIMAVSVYSQQQSKGSATTIRPTTIVSVNVTVAADDSSTTISEEETPEPRQGSRSTSDLCRDVKGCRCEQNNKMLDCNGQTVGVSEVIIPVLIILSELNLIFSLEVAQVQLSQRDPEIIRKHPHR